MWRRLWNHWESRSPVLQQSHSLQGQTKLFVKNQCVATKKACSTQQHTTSPALRAPCQGPYRSLSMWAALRPPPRVGKAPVVVGAGESYSISHPVAAQVKLSAQETCSTSSQFPALVVCLLMQNKFFPNTFSSVLDTHQKAIMHPTLGTSYLHSWAHENVSLNVALSHCLWTGIWPMTVITRNCLAYLSGLVVRYTKEVIRIIILIDWARRLLCGVAVGSAPAQPFSTPFGLPIHQGQD